MKEISTLIWSEWRRQRKTALILLASTAAFSLLLLVLTHFKFYENEFKLIASAFSIGLPLLYAIVLGDSFISEFTGKSCSFLLGLPISKTKIYFAKYTFSLLLFLAVSFIGSMLMYACGNKFFEERLPIAFIASVYILIHVAILLCNLISRNNNNGIIMLLILPVLFIILVPGIFSVNMFFFTTDAYWLTTSTISTVIILYIILLMSGWYLWNKRISRDLKCLKPILKVLGVMFATSILLYCLAHVYINYQYNSALQKAQENNLILQESTNLYAVELPNASIVFSKYIKKHKINRMPLYKKIASQPYSYSIWNELHKKRKGETEYLNNQDVRNLYSILEKVSVKYKTQNFRDFHIARFNTRVAIIFLIDMAYSQARAGENKAFFKTLRLASKYCVLLRKMEREGADRNPISEILLRLIYYTIIRLGQEDSAYADDYQKALNFIQNNKVYCPPYDLLSHLCHIISLLDSRSSPNHPFTSIYYRLRAKQGLASWIRYEIKRNKLYLEAQKKLYLKEIIKKDKILMKEAEKIAGFCKDLLSPVGLEIYFRSRSVFTGDKICLALKIFRCRHGKYPDKLEELCPEILKEIPLVPITQKPYKYKRDKDGFILDAGKFKRNVHGSNKTFAFIGIYIRKYQPWEEKTK